MRLLREGHEVFGYDGMTRYYDPKLKEARLARLAAFPNFRQTLGMLEDQEKLRAAVAEARPEVMLHLAAQAGVRYSLENPKAYVDSNLVGSWALLEAAREARPAHLLLASTSSIYGANAKIPFSELDRAEEPLTLYAASKKAMEAVAHSYAHLHGIPTTAFRFFTVYGPWGRPDMAPLKFATAILENREIEIYGHGRMSRDFTYVGDLVESILDLARIAPAESNRVPEIDSLSAQAPFRAVNIGGGEPVGLMAFVETLERLLGRPARRKMLPMQQGDVPRTFADPALLLALTGRKPQTSLEEGLREFVDWLLEHRRGLDEAA